jgi:hypothetical protein
MFLLWDDDDDRLEPLTGQRFTPEDSGKDSISVPKSEPPSPFRDPAAGLFWFLDSPDEGQPDANARCA